VLRVPTTALRFRPQTGSVVEGAGKPRGAAVYRLADGKPERVAVKTGISDKAYTQIVSGTLKAGDTVIVADLAAKKENGGMSRGRLF